MRQKTTTTTTGDGAQGHHGIQPRAQHRSKQPLGENLEYEAENCLTKYYQRIVLKNIIKGEGFRAVMRYIQLGKSPWCWHR